MTQFIRRNYNRILQINKVVFILALLVAVIATGGSNKITALATAEQIPEGPLFSQLSEVIFAVAVSVFILNLLVVSAVTSLYKPEFFLTGHNKRKRFSNQRLVAQFMNSAVRTASKLSDRDFAIFLLEEMKQNNMQKHPYLQHITIGRGKTPDVVKANSELKMLNDSQLKKLVTLTLQTLGHSKGTEDDFRTVLRYDLDFHLKKELEEKGILI